MGKKIILTVDDEVPITNMLKSVLEPEGFKVVVANGGEEALKKLEKLRPDLVLLDMLMPGMSGRELCQKIKSDPKSKSLKVVFLTVINETPAGKKEMKRLNVLDYITKPFQVDDFLQRVKRALEK